MLIQNLSSKKTSLSLFKSSPAIAGFFVLVTLFFSGCDLFSFGVKSKTILAVEKNSLTVSQFSKLLADKLKELDPLSAKDPSVLKTFKAKIASDFIVDALIEKWFFDQKLSLSSADLEKEINATISGFPSDKVFREELAEQNKSYQEWRKNIEIGLKRKALFAALRKQTTEPSPEELQAYYQNNKLKYFQNESVLTQSILLQDENQAEIVLKLSKKTPFESLFKDYSLDKNTTGAINYGWVERAQGSDLEPIFTTKKSTLIGPIQFAEGYRLFKVLQRKQSYQKTFDEVRVQVKTEVLSLRETARFSAWLDEQIKKYKIYKNQQAMDSLVVETRED